MSNSKLVDFTRISPNSSARTAKINSIIIHHMASTALTIEMCGAEFARKERKASSNYGVGTDGRIGLYVDESRRAWTSSNWQADNKSVTIEVQNCKKAPNWEVSDKALQATIDLCVDICQRNGIKKLNYTGDKTGNLLMHKWFAATGCPGPYLGSKFPYIAEEVNKRLGVSGSASAVGKNEEKTEVKDTAANVSLSVGDEVTLAPNATYTNGKSIAAFVFKKTLYVRKISGNNITVSIYKTGAVTGVVDKKYIIKKADGVVSYGKTPYTVQVKRTDLNIRKGAGTNYAVNGVIKPGVYTIIQEKNGWGKLKSGAGWISLAYCTKL